MQECYAQYIIVELACLHMCMCLISLGICDKTQVHVYCRAFNRTLHVNDGYLCVRPGFCHVVCLLANLRGSNGAET